MALYKRTYYYYYYITKNFLLTTVESQNAGFGIISNAAWLDKYAETTPVTVVNPFLDDIFDPFAIKREALEGKPVMAFETTSFTYF